MSTGARVLGHRPVGTGTVQLRNGGWWWRPPRHVGELPTPKLRGPYDYRKQAEAALQDWLNVQKRDSRCGDVKFGGDQ